MKLLLRKNVESLGIIGDVVEVRPGYARNYLLPQGLGMVPTEANLKAIEAEKRTYLAELARQRAELEARARVLDGREYTITALANEEGHLYGSIGPAQIVAVVGADGVFVEEDDILLDEPFRQLDNYEVKVGFGEDITATITVNVVSPAGGEGEGEARDAPAGESEDAAETPADPGDRDG